MVLNKIYIISKLESLFLVTTSVSDEPEPDPASSFFSLSEWLLRRWEDDESCQAGIDGGTVDSGLANCFLRKNKNKIKINGLKYVFLTNLFKSSPLIASKSLLKLQNSRLISCDCCCELRVNVSLMLVNSRLTSLILSSTFLSISFRVSSIVFFFFCPNRNGTIYF